MPVKVFYSFFRSTNPLKIYRFDLFNKAIYTLLLQSTLTSQSKNAVYFITKQTRKLKLLKFLKLKWLQIRRCEGTTEARFLMTMNNPLKNHDIFNFLIYDKLI